MMAPGESAAKWLRVSTGKQDEANQEPDIDTWCREHGYVVRKVYTLRGKSASKGKQDLALDEMVEDMRRGVFKVLVVWASDRIERRGAYNAFDLARRVKEAGGRIEYVKDTYLNLTNDMSDVMLALAASRDKMESKRKTERTLMTYGRIRTSGAFIGKTPFGYVARGEKYSKRLEPTEAGRRLIPEVFQRCIDGQSLATIGAWMEQETGVAWWPVRVGKTIRNSVYRGVQEDDDGCPIHRCEALVDAATWRRANEALSSRPKRGPQNGPDRALLAEVLFCLRCANRGIDSPMYRVRPSTTSPRAYYRCAGRGSQRRGCGHRARVATLDGVVNLMMRKNDLPYREYRVVPGTDHAAEIEETKFAIREVMMSDLPDEEIDAKVKALRAERDRLQALPTVPDRVEMVDTGKTWGQVWKSLDPAERGPWLREKGYKVLVSNKERVVVRDSTGAEAFEFTWASYSPEPGEEEE